MIPELVLVCASTLLVAGTVRLSAQPGPAVTTPYQPTNAFSVFGRVTGPGERPLAGVTVRVNCGNGTLFCTGSAITDNQGLYWCAFRPGVLVGSRFAGGLGAGLQVATVFATKQGYCCVDLGRAGNLAMTDLATVDSHMTRNFAGVVYPFKPYHLDFELQPAASLKGQLVVAGKTPADLRLSLGGKALPPSSSVLASVAVSTNGAFTFTEVPPGSNWWFEASWREDGRFAEARTKEFNCPRATEEQVLLNLDDTRTLTITRLRSAP